MIKLKFFLLYSFFTLISSCCLSDFATQFENVQQQYEKALQQLITLYSDQKPPKPIEFTESDLLGSTYYKVIHPYVLELSSYAGVVMSAYVRQFPYYDDLQMLQQKFNQYNTEVVSLSKRFATKYQQDALIYFYNQLTSSVLQNCAKILQNLSYKLNTSKEDLQAAKTAYQLAWAVQTPNMKLTMFSDIKEFQQNMTTWIANLYQAAIANVTENLQKIADKKPLYDQIAEYYEVLAAVYKSAQNEQQASVEMQNAQHAKQAAAQFVQAGTMIQEAEKLAESGRLGITIDFSKPNTTKTALITSLQDLQKAQALYTNASNIYTTMQDNDGINLCSAKTGQISGDTHVRGIQLLWVLFLEDAYRQDVATQVKAHEALKLFFATDPTVHDSINVTQVQQALQDLMLVCTKAPNNFNETLAIIPLLQGAVQEYQSATSAHPQADSKTRLITTAMLHDLQKILTAFVSMLQALIGLGDVNSMSFTNLVLQAVNYANSINNILKNNVTLFDFFVNFADFNTQVTEQKSMVSFVIQYVYRIALSYIETQLAKSTKDDQALLQGLSYLIALQPYVSYLTEEQKNQIDIYTKKIVLTVHLQDQLTNAYNKARQRNRWQNSAKASGHYQSVSNSLWQHVIQLYQVAIQLSLSAHADEYDLVSSSELQKTYVQILQDYVTAFLQKGWKAKGYQLSILVPLYELYFAADKIQDSKASSYALATLQSLFGAEGGFFDEMKNIDLSKTPAKGIAQNSQHSEDEIKNMLAMLSFAIEQEQQAATRLVSLFALDKPPALLLQQSEAGEIVTVTMDLDGKTYTVHITNPIAVTIQKYTKEATNMLSLAEEDEKKQNYSDAMKSYETLQQLYLKILPLISSPTDEQSYKDRYFLAKTRYSATSLASQISMSGAVTLGKITQIPEQYYTKTYVQHGLDVSKLGTSMPSALQKFTKLTIMETDQARSMALDLLKAFMVSQILLQQGLNFTDYYVDYQMKLKSGISSADITVIKAVEQTIDSYFKKFEKTTYISLMVQGSVITMEVENMPIPAVTPLYPGAPYAGVYFAGAATLFAPGNKLLQIGGVSYVPGQDETASQQMYEDLGYAYISEAQQNLQTAQIIINELFASLTKQVKAGKEIDIKTFSNEYNKAKNSYVRAQSLLMAEGGSAYYYFEQAKQVAIAAEVKAIFLTSFVDQIAQYRKLLLGNPTSDAYTMVVSDINQAYISWSSELDPSADANQIAANEQAIVTLYVDTAQACLQYQYIQAMFPHYKQYHYMTAASNYESANKQYQNMQNTEQAAKMNDKVMEAYFLGCVQNVLLYYSTKKNGLVYTPTQILGVSGSVIPKKITFNQLMQGYRNFQAGSNVNPGETAAYTTVKDLLINAAMFFQLVAGNYQKQVSPSNQSNSSTAKGKSKRALNPKLLKYLTGTKKIFSSKFSNVPYTQKGILPKLFHVAQDVFLHFYNDPAVLASWCDTLNMAVAYQYIDDYEGGVTSSSQDIGSGDFKQKWIQFFQAVQKQTSALQNPSAAYVG